MQRADHFVQVIENWEGDGHLPNRGGEDQDLSKKTRKAGGSLDVKTPYYLSIWIE